MNIYSRAGRNRQLLGREENHMLKDTRLKKIYELLQRDGSVEINTLCRMFNVTDMTVRRDLESLSQKYDIVRTHGGAMMVDDNRVGETPYEKRIMRNENLKIAIAKKALSLLKQGSKLFIDSGTTTLNVAKHILYDDMFTVVTNGLNIANELINHDSISVLLIGGDVEKNTHSTRGALAVEQMHHLKVDVAFLGANAIGEDGFLYVGNTSETGIKKSVIESAAKTYVLADSTKFSTYSLIDYAHAKDVAGIITDSNINSEIYKKLTEYGVNIIVAEL